MSRKKKPAPEERERIDPTLTTEPEVVVEDWQEEQRFDRSLRPHDLNDYIGQEGVKQNLRIAIEAARQRGDVASEITQRRRNPRLVHHVAQQRVGPFDVHPITK